MKFKSIEDIRKYFLNPGNLLNCPPLEKAVDAAKLIFPNKSKNEKQIREKDRSTVASGDFGSPIMREPAFVDGKPNRRKITMGTSVWSEQIPITEETVKHIHDAGFDLITCTIGGENREKLIDLAAKYDIAVLAENPTLPPKGVSVEEMTDEKMFDGVVHQPNVWGYYGWDEPNKSEYDRIGRYSGLYAKAFPDRVMFNNLFPACCAEQQYGTKSYRDYVESYAKNVPGDYISVDIYPFYSFSLINFFGAFQALQTYDTLGSVCRDYGRDFWIYTQTQGNWFSHLYLLVTFEQIKWQIYTAIAYGARLFIEISMDPCWGRHAYSMMNGDGTLTEQYLYARRMNAEIKELSPVISQYRSLGVLPSTSKGKNHTFDKAFKYQRDSSKQQGFFGIDEVKCVRSETSALVGYFGHEETEGKGLLIVNCKDLFDSSAQQSVSVELNGLHDVAVYKKGRKYIELKQVGKVCFTFDSCDGVFVTID